MKKQLLKICSMVLSVILLESMIVYPAYAGYVTTDEGNTVYSYAKESVDSHEMSSRGLCQTFAWECLYDTLEIGDRGADGCCATKAWQSYGVSTARYGIPVGAAVYFGGSKTTDSYCGQEAGHVGIYIGNDEIAHAWSSTIICKTTIQHVIDSGYYYRGWGWQGGYPLASLTDEISVFVGTESVAFDQMPLIQNGRTLVPVRSVSEAMGVKVEWIQSSQTVRLSKDGKRLEMQIGNDTYTAYCAGRKEYETFDVSPQIINGRTLLPIRSVAEFFDYDVSWDETSHIVCIGKNTVAV